MVTWQRGGARRRPFFPIPQQNLPLNHLLINALFTTATIWRSMPFHSTLPWFRTMTPTATGLNKCKEKEQKQSYAGSFHLITIPGVSLMAMSFFPSLTVARYMILKLFISMCYRWHPMYLGCLFCLFVYVEFFRIPLQ